MVAGGTQTGFDEQAAIDLMKQGDVSLEISIGRTPTFGGSGRKIEAHLLNFDGDLYGKSLRLEFGRRLRHQQTFESIALLVEQLRRDVEIVRTESGAT